MDSKDLHKQLGKTEGDVEALFRDVKDIKIEMKEVLNVVNKLVYWKFKVSGLAIGVASMSTIVLNKTINLLHKFF